MAEFYPRKLLTLEVLKDDTDVEELSEVISNLKSPLGLALILIDGIFTDDGKTLTEYSTTLDETKKIAFGLGSAERLIESGDRLAMYSLYQFAFQQYVQSSFRARQGKALEEIMKKILTIEEMKVTPEIASSKPKKVGILKRAINDESKVNELLAKHDIDILAYTEFEPESKETKTDSKSGESKKKSKIIIFQIRSRDDTGGATAKPSLAELLRDLYREELSNEILYVIYTWVKPRSGKPSQKTTLINKLLNMIDLTNNKELEKDLKDGKVVQIKDNLKLCVVYGADELIKRLWEDFGIEIDERYKALMEKYKSYLELLSSWDDLWMAYAVATIELENLVKHGKTNISVINEKLSQLDYLDKLRSKECLTTYESCSEEIAKDLATNIRGDEDLIPFNAVGDKIAYLRDLLLLRMVYENIEDIVVKIGIDNDSTRKRIKKLKRLDSHDGIQRKITDVVMKS